MNDIYKSPESELVEKQDNRNTIEDAINGNYTLDFSDVLSEAWATTKGIKRYILGSFILIYILVMAVMLVVGGIFGGLLMGSEPASAHPMVFIVSQLVTQLVFTAIMIPLMAGIFMMCLTHLKGEQVTFGLLFGYTHKFLPLLGAAILMNIMVTLGFVLLIIPGIYLMIAYLLAIPLVIDKDLGPWEALEVSRKAITKNWFTFFGLYIVMTLILFLSLIPFGLGIIWTLPMFAMMVAVLYRNLFGISSV